MDAREQGHGRRLPCLTIRSPRSASACTRCSSIPEQPSRLWQQNHCGVYRSDDRGDNWERLEANGLPSGFGFPLALHPRDPDVAYVVPEEGAENRVTSDGRLGVYKTTDGGASWALAANGLPDPAWLAVLREGMAFDRLDPAGVYVGTQSGSVFVSPDEGGGVDHCCREPATRAFGGGRRVAVVVLLPSLLATEAGGRNRFEVEASSPREALRELPIRGLLFDEQSELRPLVNVYVDGVDVRNRGGLDEALGDGAEIRVVAAIAGGSVPAHGRGLAESAALSATKSTPRGCRPQRPSCRRSREPQSRLDARRDLHVAGGDLLRLGVNRRTVFLMSLRAELAEADPVLGESEDEVASALPGAVLNRLDGREHGLVDALERARQDVRAEEGLVGVHADAPDLLLLRRVECAEPAAACDLEDDPAPGAIW